MSSERPMAALNYSTLETDVTAWQEQFLANVREDHGEDQAEAARKELEADPWKALQWYVEDMKLV